MAFRARSHAMRKTAVVMALVLLGPAKASARALEREGTVAVLTAVRAPSRVPGAKLVPGLALSFGFKPLVALEFAVDIAAHYVQADAFSMTTLPLGLTLKWTPLPSYELRPIFTATLGKEFVALDGPAGRYREHTPYLLVFSGGAVADLGSLAGIYADVGYQYARVKDTLHGVLDAGGPLVRAGVYFRWEPLRKPPL